MRILRFLVVISVVVGSLLTPITVFASNTLDNVRVWPSAERTRIVFDLSAEPNFTYFTIFDTAPHRVVVDFHQTSNRVNLGQVEFHSDVLNVIRSSGPPRQGTFRVVLEIASANSPTVFSLGPANGSGHRLVVDVPGATAEVSRTPSTTATTSTETRAPRTAEVLPPREIVIAIDAGHGGRDPGSIGPAGTQEKVVTLAVARKLAQRINADPGMRAVLTRSSDQTVPLGQRTSLARRERADFFVSLHADAFTSAQPRGASVWVLSARRSETELGRALENKERLSEELIDVEHILQDNDSDQFLNRTLLDMYRDSSMAGGHEAAVILLDHLGRVTNLHRNRPEAASFAVLNSLRTPSVLVELGFISNPQKERLLINERHQDRLANALYEGIREYFLRNPVENTLLAEMDFRTHVVASGESLSVIARRYGSSVDAIRKHNNLRSNTIRIGQRLEIPVGR
ncbi:N-acetylmuramoyl-L-alanine amidase [Aliidiomarina indica]|uniref:N-acetylmuramoyl-L-alanine amidase n=1 Tax=Aliidiomarina indica TaxID=2749147 RepID=UPI00188F9B11|nr:N-acetylmuramoyl-L-alanine amidase [Aliidiomarina indica]